MQPSHRVHEYPNHFSISAFRVPQHRLSVLLFYLCHIWNVEWHSAYSWFYLAVSGFLSQALRDGNFTLWLNNNAKASFFDYYYLFFFYIALIPWVWCSMDSRGGTEISVIYCLCTQSLWNEEESSHNMLSGNVSAGRYVTSDLIRNRSQNGLRGQCFSLPEHTAGFGCWKGPFAQNRLFCVAGGKENHL